MKDNWMKYKDDSLVASFYDSQTTTFQEQGFETELAFGTAGIRGQFGLGPGRLNRYTIQRLALGIANYLKDKEDNPSIVIHYDIRHLSSEFAHIITQILTSKGIKVYLADVYKTTPQLSFAVRYLQTSAGIMITASHNPKDYNGIKVYGADGAQLDEDTSLEVAQYINNLGNPLELNIDLNQELIEKNTFDLQEAVYDSYINEITNLIGDITQSDLKVVYTSLHGTGVPIIPDVLKHLNFQNVSLVELQCELDPNFSSVKSANPEEREAFDLAIQQAHDLEANLIIATDPDVDRMGFVERDTNGQTYYFGGSEIGALLIKYLLEYTNVPNHSVVIQSIVSGELGKRLAQQHEVTVKEVLIGFKHIAKAIRELDDTESFLFAYEESYGYLADDFVRDKDAIQIVPLIIKYASILKNEGKTLHDALKEIHREVGQYRDKPMSKVFEGREGQQQINALMDKLRRNIPDVIAGLKVIAVEDYETLKRIYKEDNMEEAISLPQANVIRILFKEGFIALRPSGTEPKLKFYLSLNVDNFEQVSQDIYNYIFGDTE
ncbi:phospho-sugar mutase [Staphylococcus haemolyticus]|uniref:phospho-sugar mutase n=1 Tax=Staphylococcus haemolyticus TaxID=1283 RepID=UPI001374FD83|nr:phospho-sugar mutase [Staphylococcus haemolyticus]QUX18079.1 phospho-sugar mutase [Staphylococcus haemolyticus]UCI00046.1 phospho-sugar mutase [Staphylococcus haemolyticus]UCI02263.1 phospho-sugar mutase [Staphylococcus haemolyticus]